jgi:hypothetical protein
VAAGDQAIVELRREKLQKGVWAYNPELQSKGILL